MATSGSGILIYSQSNESSDEGRIAVIEESTPPPAEFPVLDSTTASQEVWPEDVLDEESRLLPAGLPADAGEVMAKAFHESLRLYLLIPSFRAMLTVLALAAVLAGLDVILPAVAANVAWGMVMGVALVGFLPLGEMLIDQAWRRPSDLPRWQTETLKPNVSLSIVGALLLMVLPITLGFLVGLAWFTILAVPCSAMGTLWLMSSRVSPILEGFPFLNPLARREVGAILLSSLAATCGLFSVALCIRMGAGYRTSALVLALWTWLFLTRLSGLLARRYFVRIHATQHTS
jgi:hypothetical protein